MNKEDFGLIHCQTKELWISTIKILRRMGYRWTTREPIKKTFDEWDINKENSCIAFDYEGMEHSRIQFFEKFWIFEHIQSAEDFVKQHQDKLVRRKKTNI